MLDTLLIHTYIHRKDTCIMKGKPSFKSFCKHIITVGPHNRIRCDVTGVTYKEKRKWITITVLLCLLIALLALYLPTLFQRSEISSANTRIDQIWYFGAIILLYPINPVMRYFLSVFEPTNEAWTDSDEKLRRKVSRRLIGFMAVILIYWGLAYRSAAAFDSIAQYGYDFLLLKAIAVVAVMGTLTLSFMCLLIYLLIDERRYIKKRLTKTNKINVSTQEEA